MGDILSIVGEAGVATALHDLAYSPESAMPRNDLAVAFEGFGVQQPQTVIDAMLELRLLQFLGPGESLAISRTGRRTTLLLEALQGGDIEDICRRLRALDGSPERYELVRQGMTTRFIESLTERPDFGRLYVCSPWINLSGRDAAILRYAVMQMQKLGLTPEVLVITRPPELQPEAIRNGLEPFIEVGSTVHFLRRLHTKLYIREPNPSGGPLMALIGSENLTQSNNLELGIKINGDTAVINQLIAHFLELMTYS